MRGHGHWAAKVGVLTLAAAVGCWAPTPAPALFNDSGPFANLDGWWAGDGRLRFKDGKQEEVKCRATYFVSAAGQQLKQTIRCASGSGKVEVTSEVKHEAGAIGGTWTETVYNLAGEISGQITPRGYRVSVKGAGADLSANMDIIVRDKKQIVEIQFFSETLLGLTLVLEKGEARGEPTARSEHPPAR